MSTMSFDEFAKGGNINFADRSRKPRSSIGPGNLPAIAIGGAASQPDDETAADAPEREEFSFESFTGRAPVAVAPVEPEAPEQPSRWSGEALLEGAKDLAGVFKQGADDRFFGALSRAGVISPDDPRYVAGVGMDDPFALDRAIQRKKDAGERAADQQSRTGFVGSLRNPLDAIANEGATQFLLERTVGGLNVDRVAMDVNERVALEQQEARQLAARQRILANPSEFPQATVDAARAAQAEYEAKENKTVGQEAGEMVDNLAKQFEERPTETLATFANAIIALLYMVV